MKKTPLSVFLLLAIVLILLKVLLLFTSALSLSRPFLLGTDFRAFYTGGRMLSQTVTSDFYNLSTQYSYQRVFTPKLTNQKQLMPFIYPPFVALFFRPLAVYPFEIAYRIWIVLQIALLILVFKLTLKSLKKITYPFKFLLVAMILLFPPLWNALLQGQLSVIIIFSLVTSWLSLKSGKNVLGGLCLSLLLVRPHLLIVPTMILLLNRRWLSLSGLALSSSVLLVFSVLLVGLQGLAAYGHLLTSAVNWGDAYTVHPKLEPTWRGFLQTLFNSNYMRDIQILWILGILCALGLLVLTWSQTYKASSSRFDLCWALMVIVMIFTSLHTNYHDLSLLVVSNTLIIRYLGTKKKYDTQDKLLFVLLLSEYIAIPVTFYATVHKLHGGLQQTSVVFMMCAIVLLVWRLASLNRKTPAVTHSKK